MELAGGLDVQLRDLADGRGHASAIAELFTDGQGTGRTSTSRKPSAAAEGF